MLVDLGPRTSGKAHHMPRDIEVAAMVDAELGDDEGRVVGANLAVSDLHGLRCTRGVMQRQESGYATRCVFETR